ncbi:DUF2306 domain-containing protein [Pseudoxanthomonas suwonensis]|uniref:DUF2306 domain-containing protein n=1 Tax=Pseudoxanthomonas suwonensis TaxID=314722 RepID=A0A0E3UM65_9GAMM|nr:DUF2306 domain-containing protein [Pseudoxanthomonas suwonensis]AKC85770.1 hypothetical protein WQ53_02355 [Pseudoxanthomonas suwonensis]
MRWNRLGWVAMAVLALAVAAYAFAVALTPEWRPPLVRDLFGQRPLAAWGHLLGGGVALAAGAFQLNTRLRNRWLGLHRWLGRVYAAAVGVGGLSALVLAPHALTGAVAATGFALLGLCWLATTALAVRAIRGRRLAAHRDWMVRSYALTLAAVTLRIYLGSSQLAGISFTVAYPAIAWLCWVPNLLLAEWFVRSPRARAMLAASAVPERWRRMPEPPRA